MNQYIITEELVNLVKKHSAILAARIKLYPYNPQAEQRVLDKAIGWLQAMADIANGDANRQENWIEAAAHSGRCAGFLQAKDMLEKLRQKDGEL